MRGLVREALVVLGIRRLVLGVHDAALPADGRDDIGRGQPGSLGGRRFFAFASALGFDGLQLGPQGETSEHDASPYDGTIFSRSTLSIAPGLLVEQGLLDEDDLHDALQARPSGSDRRTAHRHAWRAMRGLLGTAYERAASDRADPLWARLSAFEEQQGDWLRRDALYGALAAEHGELDWLRWPQADRELWQRPGLEARDRELRERHATLLERFAFEQLLAHEQHADRQREAAALGLKLYGDLQIGLGHPDVWSLSPLLFQGYRMGAPPSRTNPEGQPWSYALLDPRLYGAPGAPGPALQLLRRRVDKLLSEFNGLRIDHPHGLIDPWVYRAAQPDPLRAVQQGARLFSSPDLDDHRELAGLAIAEPPQLDRAQPRHADGWVRTLRDEQVERYAVLFDAVVGAARAHGRDVHDLVAEVLSTQPYPVMRVIERHGLGRFRVTQKASLDDPRDVYRSENARPEDWILCGNHDTDSIWRASKRWHEQGRGAAHARHLASRLVRDDSARAAWAERIAREPRLLASARLAELFVGPAANVMVFFTDLLGLEEPYNRPGTVDESNWSLRVPPDFEQAHAHAAARGLALDLRGALAAALRARAGPAALCEALEGRRSDDQSASLRTDDRQ